MAIVSERKRIDQDIVVQFLTEEAKRRGFCVFDSIFGQIHLHKEKDKRWIEQSSGAVYGIVMQSEKPPNTDTKALKDHPNFYPIYWGKDISPISRMKAHVNEYKSTGNAGLNGISEITGKKLFFGAIMVCRYKEFENHLHIHFRPLRKSNTGGRGPSVVKILC